MIKTYDYKSRTLVKETSKISYQQYCSVVNLLENPNREIALSLPGPLGALFDHLKDLSKTLVDDLKIGMAELVKAFKQKSVFSLLKSVAFNLKALVKAFNKLAHTGPKMVLGLITKLHETGAFDKLQKGLISANDFLDENPLLKKIGGPVFAASLLFMWFNCMFTGHPSTDLDMTHLGKAIIGNYDLLELFGSPAALTSLVLVLTSTLGVMSGSTLIQGAVSLVSWMGSDLYNLALALAFTGLKAAKDAPAVKKLHDFILGDSR